MIHHEVMSIDDESSQSGAIHHPVIAAYDELPYYSVHAQNGWVHYIYYHMVVTKQAREGTRMKGVKRTKETLFDDIFGRTTPPLNELTIEVAEKNLKLMTKVQKIINKGAGRGKVLKTIGLTITF